MSYSIKNLEQLRDRIIKIQIQTAEELVEEIDALSPFQCGQYKGEYITLGHIIEMLGQIIIDEED